MATTVIGWVGNVQERQIGVTLSPPEVVARLRANLDPEPGLGQQWGYRLSRRHRFFGQVSPTSFRIRKWWGGRRLDDPKLVGTIHADPTGSLITFEVKPALW